MTSDPLLTLEEIRRAVALELGVAPSELRDDENLIEAGLASLPLMRLAAGWRARGADIDFAELASQPTIDTWAERLVTAGPTPSEVGKSDPDAEELGQSAFPLATMQHGYWVGRADGQPLGGVAAHLYSEFDGRAIDPSRLRDAVQTVVSRHPALRTRFRDDGLQEVLEILDRPVFSVTDLRADTDEVARVRLDELRETRTHQRLDIGAAEVIDVGLTLLPGGGTRLHVDIDMIAADAVSYRLILAEFARAYRGEPLEPTDFSYSYRKYLREHALATSTARERDAKWWADRIDDYPEAPALPLVPESAADEPHRSMRRGHLLSSRSYELLRVRAQKHGVTPSMTLAAVFADVLARWSSRQRFLLNLPLFDREPLHPDVAAMVGDFSNSVLLDVTVNPEASFIDRVRATQQNLHEHASHAAHRGLDVLRDLGHREGAPVLAPIVYTSALDLGEMFAPAVIEEFGEPVWTISQGPQVVLDAQVSELSGGILLNWDVRRDAFPPGVLDAMFDAYRALIDALIAPDSDWEAPLTIELPEQQQRTRIRVNDTDQTFPARTLHGEFFRRAAVHPDDPAVVWGDSGELSYAALSDLSLRVARALQEAGVRGGDTVGIHLRKGHKQVPAVLGILAAGATYMPIGEDQPAARRNLMLSRGRARVVLVEDDAADLPDGVTPVRIDAALTTADPLAAPADVSPETIAYVLFTSGSTGEPKGVEIPHRAAANTIDGVISVFDLTESDRTLGVSVLEFDPSVVDIFAALSLGGAFIAVDSEQSKDALEWANLADRHRASALTCAPGILRMLLDVAEPRQLRHLHAVMLGGDWVTVDLPRRLRALAPQARFAGLGGTTETAIHCTVYEVTDDTIDDGQTVPYGTPLPNFKCRIVNDAGQDCPDWVAGELWVGGPSVGAGYRGDPERTAAKFIHKDGTRWYRTGDLARYRPDGQIEFLGRTDHQVKIRGYRVELGEVEAALRALKGVEAAVADTIDEGNRQLVAAVAAPGLTGDEIRTALASSLPPYMVPVHVAVLDSIPLTINGKLDRRVAKGLLDVAAGFDATSQPETNLEAALQHIIDGVLAKELPSVDVDFFAVGGDSILATTAIARIRSLLQVSSITAADFFTARTVRALAGLLQEREARADQIEQIAGIYLEVAEPSPARISPVAP